MQNRMTPRREIILRALVEEYIRTAEPVPSQVLADTYQLGFSPATIRIDLKALEEEGLVFQRHTSGGRIPTDSGYRYFVEYLMPESTLYPEEQRLIRHMFYQVQHQVDQWVRLSASILSQFLGGASVVTTPRTSEDRLKYIAILSLYDNVVLLIAVMMDGSVLQDRVYLEISSNQEELDRYNTALNARFQHATAQEVEAAIAAVTITELSTVERTLLLGIERLLQQHTTWGPEDMYQEGVTRILNQPEFTRMGDDQERGERIRKLMDAVEGRRLLSVIETQAPSEGGVQVVIGAEAENDFHDMSIILSRYGLPGKATGILGVIGPTRMQYGRAIAIVRYMTQVMNDLLAEFYSADHDSTPAEE